MARKPPHQSTLNERIQERSRAAVEGAEGKGFGERLWGSMHLEAANLADGFKTATNNEYVGAFAGGLLGLFKGIGIGLLVGGAIVVFPPLWGLAAAFGGLAVTEAAVMATCAGLGVIGFTLKGMIDGFTYSRQHSGNKEGKKLGDQIAKHSHMLDRSKSEELVQAVHDAHHRLNTREDSDKISTPGIVEEPHHRFQDLLKSERVQVHHEEHRR